MNSNNYCIIMGGGVGSRFWPYSRENKPKQFLDIFGTGRSLLQMTFDRFAHIIPIENILVVTNESYVDQVLEQLPQLKRSQILLEPMRRNTAPCVGYACYHIQARDPKANIVVTASDHLILNEEAFIQAITKGLEYTSTHANLVTLGIRPSRPETGYGYIQVENIHSSQPVEVKTFTEKPNREMAELFVRSGEFLWNSGMFIWNVETIMQALRTYMPELCEILNGGIGKYATDEEADFIHQNFSFCPSISIDYGVMEKANNVMAIPVDFGWADLGTWGSVYDLGDKDPAENVALRTKAIFHEATGNIVSMDSEDSLVVIQGLDDCIVVQSNKVLLICKKSEEQRIKQFMAEASERFNKQYD